MHIFQDAWLEEQSHKHAWPRTSCDIVCGLLKSGPVRFYWSSHNEMCYGYANISYGSGSGGSTTMLSVERNTRLKQRQQQEVRHKQWQHIKNLWRHHCCFISAGFICIYPCKVCVGWLIRRQDISFGTVCYNCGQEFLCCSSWFLNYASSVDGAV